MTLVRIIGLLPYLVDLANQVLKEQDRYSQRLGTTKLQRPYAGENSGDLAQVFWENPNLNYSKI